MLMNHLSRGSLSFVRQPRKWIKNVAGTNHYHVMSRVVDARFIFDTHAKNVFRKSFRKLEAFTGVRVITYCLMSNHFHLLIQIPERPEISDDQLLERMAALYPAPRVQLFADTLAKARTRGEEGAAEVQRLRQTMLYRMHDLSFFMKDLKQRFTQWYNRAHQRAGTLWESRFKCVLVQGKRRVLETMAAYIDLNPVRAGLCKDPKDYPHSGYGEAVAGGARARAGLLRLAGYYGELKGGKAVEALSGGELRRRWGEVQRAYRQLLYERGEQRGMGAQGEAPAAGFDREEVLKVLAQGGKLGLWQLLRCRVRYFTDGAVVGDKGFVNSFFNLKRSWFGGKRKSGARQLPGIKEASLFVLRMLKKRPFD